MGLEDQLSKNYGGLENTLENNGYPLMGIFNGFNLYQFSTKQSLLKVQNMYFAVKRSDAKSDDNRVEEAIFWKADNLAEAIGSVENMPVRPAENHGSGKLEKTLLLHSIISGGISGAITYAVTKQPGLGILGLVGGITVRVLLAAVVYTIKDEVLPKIRYNRDLRQAKKGFKDRLEGKRAIREALDWAEISQAKT